MTDNNKTLVSAGHELASELKADCGAVDMRSVANLLTELASALDVQSARSDALAAALKASEANDADARCHVAELEAKCAALAGENAALIGFDADEFSYNGPYQPDDAVLEKLKTPATDAWVKEQRAAGRVEGVNFAAARLAAAFNHGFIDKPTAEVYDVVKAVLGAKEELATAPDDGLSGEYAEQALNDWAALLRGSQV
ncbi:hypothetical protein BS423_04005 [Cronobacter sakazakii]|uniref:hypothetical protein n=1 Tax=Cronobacter sakazakii TaxID=28141 RepID=UPI000A1EA2D2|nr:hypothetical protein [Cronobacter sakazakii]PUY28628.1 hypothetical protein BS423_04005 [Cronobacter sakazakii]